MFEIEWIKEKATSEEYYFSEHADEERKEENIKVIEVEQALTRGSILEQYEDTGRGESCLVVGFTDEGKPIHVVCGRRNGRIVIVTIYIPKPPKFKTPYERG